MRLLPRKGARNGLQETGNRGEERCQAVVRRRVSIKHPSSLLRDSELCGTRSKIAEFRHTVHHGHLHVVNLFMVYGGI